MVKGSRLMSPIGDPTRGKDIESASWREIKGELELNIAEQFFGDIVGSVIDVGTAGISSITLPISIGRIALFNRRKQPPIETQESSWRVGRAVHNIRIEAERRSSYKKAKRAARKQVLSTTTGVLEGAIGGYEIYSAINHPGLESHNWLTGIFDNLTSGTDIHNFYLHHNPSAEIAIALTALALTSQASHVILQNMKERYFATRYRRLSPRR